VIDRCDAQGFDSYAVAMERFKFDMSQGLNDRTVAMAMKYRSLSF
jgi:hypothetical protein